MPFSAIYALLALVVVVVVFEVVRRWRGWGFAVAAGGLALAGLFAVFVGMVLFITSQMP